MAAAAGAAPNEVDAEINLDQLKVLKKVFEVGTKLWLKKCLSFSHAVHPAVLH